MLEVLKKAGIKPPEFATIVGVSRVAVYNWTSTPKSAAPHTMVAARVKKALGMLRALTERGQLPLKADLDKSQRLARITKIKQLLDKLSG
jgi:hypothetical protein